MDVLDRVLDLLGAQVATEVLDQAIATVRTEYGGSNQYVRRDQGVRIRQMLHNGVADTEIQRRFGLSSAAAIDYHRRLL